MFVLCNQLSASTDLCSSADRLNLAPRIASLISWRTELRSRLLSRLYPRTKARVGQGFWVYSIFGYLISGIQYFYAYNWVSIPSRPILGIKYTVFFLILVFYTSFSVIFGIYWKVYFGYFGIPLLPRGMRQSCATNSATYAGYSKDNLHKSLNNKPHLQVCTSVLKQLWAILRRGIILSGLHV